MLSEKAISWRKWGVALVVVLIAGAAWGTRDRWGSGMQARWKGSGAAASANSAKGEADSHEHAGHEEMTSIELSEQARKNIGLQVAKIQRQTFVRSIAMPGIMVERPGRTKLRVVAPMTGIVTKVHVMQGEAIRPGQPIVDLRLTHEDMLQAQVDYLKLLEELDVVNKEIERLRPAVEKGAIAEKNVIDRRYEQQKLQASLKSQRESLLLHGLTSEQVAEIQKSRSLRSEHTVFAPGKPVAGNSKTLSESSSEAPADSAKNDGLLVTEAVSIEAGRFVNTGDLLLTLADYSSLLVEGNAFEQDGELIAGVLNARRKVGVRLESHLSTGDLVPDLEILYLSDEIDRESRTLHFYLRLPNKQVRDAEVDGSRFINWRFKPGERVQLLVPVEEWPQKIVLPADAVVQEGVESFVFQQNGDHFDRRSVQVEYRDRFYVVIAQDGSLVPGDSVVITGAQQLLLALKTKSGGRPEPHSGHNH